MNDFAPKLPPNEGKSVSVSFRMGERLRARVRAIAKHNGNTSSDVMVAFIRWACQAHEDSAAGKPGPAPERLERRLERTGDRRKPSRK